MDFWQLRTFLAVLDQASLSRAADVLHVGQSTVSFHLKALEAALGVRLVDRRRGRGGAGSLGPTAAGSLLRKYALRLLALRDEAVARLAADERGEGGHVTIAASTIPAEYLVPPALARFHGEHPRVAVTVEVSDSRKAVAALLAQECDLALVGAPVRDRRVLSVPFAEDEILLVGATRGRHAAQGRLGPRDLARIPIVVREEGSGTRVATAALLARQGAALGAGGTAVVQVGSSEAARQCVLQGLGLTFISRRAVSEDLARGRLCRIAFPGTPVRRRFFVARLRSLTPSAAVRLFVQTLLLKASKAHRNR